MSANTVRRIDWAKIGKRVERTFGVVVVNFLVLVALLLMIEAGVRIAMPEVQPLGIEETLFSDETYGGGYGFRPNSRGASMGAEVVVNDKGFRIDPELPPISSKDDIILVIGDSIAMGVGVAASNSYPYILDRKLPGKRIINAAVPGYEFEDHERVLRAFLAEFDVEGVIIALTLNDIHRPIQSPVAREDAIRPTWSGLAERYPNPMLRSLKYFSENIFDFNAFLRRRWMSYLVAKDFFTDTSKNYFLYDKRAYSGSEVKGQLEEKLRRLQSLTEENDVWSLFIVLPYEYQVREAGSSDQLDPQRKIVGAASRVGIKMADLYPEFIDAVESGGPGQARTLYLFGDPMHLSVRGHALVAEALYQRLVDVWRNDAAQESP